MHKHYLAIDIGASSGRLILGWLEDGSVRLLELHRFATGMTQRKCRLCWDLERIFDEILIGMRKCRDLGIIPVSMGIDTWGVDYVLLDDDDRVLGDTVAYRDSRTVAMDAEVFQHIGEAELYARTGIQKMQFNTIYQLMAQKLTEPEILERAVSFLMIPDYLHFRLTGQKVNEYTNATTTQLVNAHARTWDMDLIRQLGFPTRIFGSLHQPGTLVGGLRNEIAAEIGFNTEVVLPATHDTASAVLAVPTADDDAIYISSGTWSLMGVERAEADCREESRRHNFTNEGGYAYRFRYLKNIMGLWMIQSLREEIPEKPTFAQLAELAGLGLTFPAVVDVNAPAFLAPESMKAAIQEQCRQTNQPVPQSDAELLGCVYKSLAEYYARTAAEIEELTGRHYTRIHIIGGGSRDTLLNRLTGEYSRKAVIAGPAEATAIGNTLVQMLHNNEFTSLADARRMVQNMKNER